MLLSTNLLIQTSRWGNITRVVCAIGWVIAGDQTSYDESFLEKEKVSYLI